MRRINLGFALAAAVALSFGMAPCGWSQSDAKGLLNRLKQKRQEQQRATATTATTNATPVPATGAQAQAETPKIEDDIINKGTEFLNSSQGQEAMKKVQEALAGQDTDELLKKGESLVKDQKTLDSMVKEGSKLAESQGLQGVSTDKIQGLIGNVSAEDLKNLKPEQIEAAKQQMNQLQGALPPGTPVPDLTAPAGVPIPTDPVATKFVRPAFDAKKMTQITADRAEFDANTNEVAFEGNVNVDHPEFDMTCDILLAFLQKSPGEQPAGISPTQAVSAGGIDRAVAKGYVQIQKLTPDGKIQVAKSRYATFESKTGDVVLTDFPSLQDGVNLIRGKSETTKIYLRQNGKYEVDGPVDVLLDSGGGASLPMTPRPSR